MKTKILLIVLLLCIGQFAQAQNKKLTQAQKDSIEEINQIRKLVYEKINLSELQNIQGTRKDEVDEAHKEKLKNDSIVKTSRYQDSLKFVAAFKEINVFLKYIKQIEIQKKIKKEDQKRIIKSFLVVLENYKNWIISYDKANKLDAEYSYEVNKLIEQTEKLVKDKEELLKENAALKKEIQRLRGY